MGALLVVAAPDDGRLGDPDGVDPCKRQQGRVVQEHVRSRARTIGAIVAHSRTRTLPLVGPVENTLSAGEIRSIRSIRQIRVQAAPFGSRTESVGSRRRTF